MNKQASRLLTFFVLVLLSLSLFFWGLVQAQPFLMPLTVATLLAMIVLPVCRWLENKGLNRGWASFLADSLIILFIVVLAGVIAAQVESLSDDWPKIKQRIEPRIEQLQQYIAQKTGLSEQEQDRKISLEIPGFSADSVSDSTQRDSSSTGSVGGNETTAQKDRSSAGSSAVSSAGSIIGGFFGGVGTLLLILVYTFFFLLYRKKFMQAMLKMAPSDQHESTQKIIADAARVSQQYLSGRILLVIFLAVLYAIGLTISGVRNAILVSLLAALLSLLPYIGNVIGYAIAVTLAFVSGGGAGGAIGVTITFTIAQFVESYVLEPYVVGDRVDLNPVVTIVVVVLGEAVWGIVGMLVAIPLLGILKVVFDHVSVLQPLGYLLGDEDTGGDGDNLLNKTKRWALDTFKR